MKKKVFIGSSSESANIAEKIKVHLQQEYDCIIWNDNFFQPNNSTYDDLQKKSIYFDFAVFVGGKDDFVMRYSNRKKKKAVRDNIYFELDTVDNSQINVLTQRTMHRICTAATNEEVSFAYRVAIPRQRFRWRNAFSTRWRSL